MNSVGVSCNKGGHQAASMDDSQAYHVAKKCSFASGDEWTGGVGENLDKVAFGRFFDWKHLEHGAIQDARRSEIKTD